MTLAEQFRQAQLRHFEVRKQSALLLRMAAAFTAGVHRFATGSRCTAGRLAAGSGRSTAGRFAAGFGRSTAGRLFAAGICRSTAGRLFAAGIRRSTAGRLAAVVAAAMSAAIMFEQAEQAGVGAAGDGHHHHGSRQKDPFHCFTSPNELKGHEDQGRRCHSELITSKLGNTGACFRIRPISRCTQKAVFAGVLPDWMRLYRLHRLSGRQTEPRNEAGAPGTADEFLNTVSPSRSAETNSGPVDMLASTESSLYAQRFPRPLTLLSATLPCPPIHHL